MVAADPTHRGRFSVAVPMNRGGEYHVYTTNDSGKTWSRPAVVTEDAGKSKYFGVMAYSPNGVLGIAWHSRLAAAAPQQGQPFQRPSASPFNIWAAISRDKGATFSRPVKASTGDSPAGNDSGDDYSGIALDREYLYTTWADWRPGTRQNYMAAMPFADFK
jgi:Neuraminidase (sialidase)